MCRQILMQLCNTNLPANPFGDLELWTSCVQSNRENDFNGDFARMREKLKMTKATNDYTRKACSRITKLRPSLCD